MTTTFTFDVPYYGEWRLVKPDDEALVTLQALTTLGFSPSVSVT